MDTRISERVLGGALAGRRDDVVIVTKVGNLFDEQTRTGGGTDLSSAYLRRACDASLRRLDTDRIDVYLIHDGPTGREDDPAVVDVLEELVAAGKLRPYGSSVADPAIVRVMAEGPHMVAAEHELNVLRGELETLSVAKELGLASLDRTPLAMGLLSGRYRPDALPAADDVRRNAPWWDFFDEGAMERWLDRIAEVRAELTADGRSLVQGALGWIRGHARRRSRSRDSAQSPRWRRTSVPASTGRFAASRWRSSGRSCEGHCRRDPPPALLRAVGSTLKGLRHAASCRMRPIRLPCSAQSAFGERPATRCPGTAEGARWAAWPTCSTGSTRRTRACRHRQRRQLHHPRAGRRSDA